VEDVKSDLALYRKEGVTSMIQCEPVRESERRTCAAVLVLSAYYVSIRAHVLTPSATKTGELLSLSAFGKLGG